MANFDLITKMLTDFDPKTQNVEQMSAQHLIFLTHLHLRSP